MVSLHRNREGMKTLASILHRMSLSFSASFMQRKVLTAYFAADHDNEAKATCCPDTCNTAYKQGTLNAISYLSISDKKSHSSSQDQTLNAQRKTKSQKGASNQFKVFRAGLDIGPRHFALGFYSPEYQEAIRNVLYSL